MTPKPCGWSDWGTPERLLDSLRGSDGYDAFVQRLNAHARVHVGPSSSAPRNVDKSAKIPAGSLA